MKTLRVESLMIGSLSVEKTESGYADVSVDIVLIIPVVALDPVKANVVLYVPKKSRRERSRRVGLLWI